MDVGVHSRSANEANQKSYSVSQIVMHENFSASYLLNDIAIMKLSPRVDENTDVIPICVTSLPTSDFFGKQCVVTGWGTTSEGSVSSLILYVIRYYLIVIHFADVTLLFGKLICYYNFNVLPLMA